MKIVELVAQNFKKLKVVAIRPAGDVVVLAGENDQGKSTVLDAINTALQGKAVAGPTPIREGETKSVIKLDVGEFAVTRTFTRKADGEITTGLKITNADGSTPAGTPQAMLNSIYGALTLDPLAFPSWSDEKQFEAIRGLVKGFDFTAHDKARKAEYEKRTEWNRQATQHEAAAAKILLPAGPKPDTVIIADLLNSLTDAEKFNNDLILRQQRRSDAMTAVINDLNRAEQLRADAARLIEQAEQLEDAAETMGTKLSNAEALPSPKDTEVIRKQIAEADTVNSVRRLHEARAAHEKLAAEAKAESDKLTAAIEARDAAKKAAIAATKLPIEGLDIADGMVLFNGLPVSQAGTAARIKIGMAIGLALNPTLRVLLVDQGSELDKKSLKLVEEFARDHDAQVWLTRCSQDSGMPEIIIEDGEVAGK